MFKKKRNTKFEEICKMKQHTLKRKLQKKLENMNYTTINERGYLLGVPNEADNNYNVLLCAHMDTVHKEQPRKFIFDPTNGRWSSPQGIGGDDRCGIYMILEIIKTHRCLVLFTEDEEIGCVGAGMFAESFAAQTLLSDPVDYVIELDRRGDNDVVFYDCDNPEFTNFVTEDKYFVKNYGSCSDICSICPAINSAGANFSAGYFHEHHLDENVDLQVMEKNIGNIKKILEKPAKHFEYIRHKWSLSDYGLGKGYSKYFDYDYDMYGSYGDYFKNDYPTTASELDISEVNEAPEDDGYIFEIEFYDEESAEDCIAHLYNIHSEAEGILKFLIENSAVRFCDIYDYLLYKDDEEDESDVCEIQNRSM